MTAIAQADDVSKQINQIPTNNSSKLIERCRYKIHMYLCIEREEYVEVYDAFVLSNHLIFATSRTEFSSEVLIGTTTTNGQRFPIPRYKIIHFVIFERILHVQNRFNH